MLVLGEDEKAKYPFLTDAGEYLKDKGFSLVQFGSDPVLKLEISFSVSFFAFHPLGFLVNIWNAEHFLSTALSTALSIDPEIETWQPSCICLKSFKT